MVAYEFYLRDEKERVHLIGILPERRKNPERINHESVMNWVRKFLDDKTDEQNIFFVQVKIE